MSDLKKRRPAAKQPPPALSGALSSSPQANAATDAPEAQPVADELSFLTPPQAKGECGRLGGYRVLRVLGRGGMGMVLEAEDVGLKRRIALKVMRPELAHRATNRARFMREAQAAAAIEHLNIVPIYQVGEDNGVPFIAMPFLRGEPLDARLKRERLGLAEIVAIGRQIAEGLAAAHAQGMIHRDIKPGNIWLEEIRGLDSGTGSSSGLGRSAIHIRILDFGLAHIENDDAKLTGTGAVLGTPAYMAPEQSRGRPVDASADLFSLGVILYEMTTGQRPFRGASAIAIITSLARDTPRAPSQLNPNLPPELSALIMRMLEKEPERRLASAREAADALRNLQADTAAAASPAPRKAQREAPWAKIESSGTVLPLALPIEPEPRARSSKTAVRRKRKSAARAGYWKWAVPALAVAALGAGLLFFWAREPSNPAAPASAQVSQGQGESPLTDSSVPAGPTTDKPDNPKKDSPFVKEDQPIEGKKDNPAVVGNALVFDLGNGVKLELIKIDAKGKKFLMGSPKDEPERSVSKKKDNIDNEEQHEVAFNHSWYIGKYEVTQDQYQAMMGDNPAQYKSPNKPVDSVNWHDAKKFCEKLADKFKDRQHIFRLPSEAEWEYCCRAGTTTAYAFGKALTTQQAQVGASMGVGPKPVGSFEANAFGIFDMHGNVYEWCEDYYGAYNKAPKDGTAQQTRQLTDSRVRRGGASASLIRFCRSAARSSYPPSSRYNDLGFRVVLSARD